MSHTQGFAITGEYAGNFDWLGYANGLVAVLAIAIGFFIIWETWRKRS